jgi:hypothetical protein
MKSERRPDNRNETVDCGVSRSVARAWSVLDLLVDIGAISDQENLENVFAVGAVVRDASGQAIAAISGAVPRNQLQGPNRENLCRLVMGAAERISRRLGAHDKADPVNPIKSKSQERSARC